MAIYGMGNSPDIYIILFYYLQKNWKYYICEKLNFDIFKDLNVQKSDF